MNSEKKRIRRKQLIIVAICVVIAVVALFGLTFSKYTTKEIQGRAEYEPALFNTVLLGHLVAGDIENLEPDTQYQYAMKVYTCPNCHKEITNGTSAALAACPYCGTENTEDNPFTYVEKTQTINGEKLSTSLSLSSLTEFGADSGYNKLQISPGSDSSNYAYIYFTVSNGTTVTTETDASGNVTPKVKNLAESDIKYTLHIKTTNNLPLQFELVSIEKNSSGDDVETTYNLKDTLEQTVTETISPGRTATYTKKQSNSDYVVTTSAASSDFINGSRILKCNDDNTITNHRYKLVIKWPAKTTIYKTIEEESTTVIETSVQSNNGLSYMKELENIEVLLEVDSYVNYLERTESSDTSSEAIIVLSNDPISDGFYSLKKANSVDISGNLVYNTVSIFGKKIVRFDSFAEITQAAFSAATGITGTDVKAYNFECPFYVYNTDTVAAVWEADDASKQTYQDPLTGKSVTRAENGKSNKDGHYNYSSSDLTGSNEYNYHIVVAVPSGDDKMNASGIDWADSQYTYYLRYNGTTYFGQVTTDEVVQSDTQTYVEGREPEEYMTESVTQYKAIRFYDGSGNELCLDIPGTKLQKEMLTLYRGSDSEYVNCKDDLRMYITRSAKPAPEPETETETEYNPDDEEE